MSRKVWLVVVWASGSHAANTDIEHSCTRTFDSVEQAQTYASMFLGMTYVQVDYKCFIVDDSLGVLFDE